MAVRTRSFLCVLSDFMIPRQAYVFFFPLQVKADEKTRVFLDAVQSQQMSTDVRACFNYGLNN